MGKFRIWIGEFLHGLRHFRWIYEYIKTESTYIYRSICIHIPKPFFYYFTSKCAGYFCQIMYLQTFVCFPGVTTHCGCIFHSPVAASGRVINPSQKPLPDNTQHSQQTNIHAPGGIRTHDLSRRAAENLCFRPHDHWDRPLINVPYQITVM